MGALEEAEIDRLAAADAASGNEALNGTTDVVDDDERERESWGTPTRIRNTEP